MTQREGCADFSQRGDPKAVHRAMRLVDNSGKHTETYPHNPNRSPDRLTGVTTADGRFTVLIAPRARVPARQDELDERGALGAQSVDADVWERGGG